MSGYQIGRVTEFELEVIGFRILLHMVPLPVKQVNVVIEFHPLQYHSFPVWSASQQHGFV